MSLIAAIYKEAGKPVSYTHLDVYKRQPYEQIATVIQANLAQIGITVDLVPMEQAALKAACKDGKQSLFLWRWNEDSKVDFVYRDLFYKMCIRDSICSG